MVQIGTESPGSTKNCIRQLEKHQKHCGITQIMYGTENATHNKQLQTTQVVQIAVHSDCDHDDWVQVVFAGSKPTCYHVV